MVLSKRNRIIKTQMCHHILFFGINWIDVWKTFWTLSIIHRFNVMRIVRCPLNIYQSVLYLYVLYHLEKENKRPLCDFEDWVNVWCFIMKNGKHSKGASVRKRISPPSTPPHNHTMERNWKEEKRLEEKKSELKTGLCEKVEKSERGENTCEFIF